MPVGLHGLASGVAAGRVGTVDLHRDLVGRRSNGSVVAVLDILCYLEGVLDGCFVSASQNREDSHRSRVLWSEKLIDDVEQFLLIESAGPILVSPHNCFADILKCGGLSRGLSLDFDGEGCSGSEGEDDGFHLVVKCVFLIC